MGAPPEAESSDLSEWQRSTRDEGALSPRTFVGYRNRNSFNQGSPPSSRRRQQSTGLLHLDYSNPSSSANKKSHPFGWLFLLSMGYKKDIFAVFAYEFELLQK